MKMPEAAAKEHADSFDRCYEKSGNLSHGLRYPLRDIEQYDWGRGLHANLYYAYMYKRFTGHTYEPTELPSKCGQVLVLGCGSGPDERNIAEMYPDLSLWSIEISKVMLRHAVNAKTPSRLARASAEALPFPDNCFDRVLSREVIEHVMDPSQMIFEVSRVLKPNGIAVITTENNDSWAPGNRLYEKYRSLIYIILGLGDSKIDTGYKDDAPTEKEFGEFAEMSKLTIERRFFDGAAYKFLPRLQRILKERRLLAIAHYLSRIENNRYFASIFCDQVKYIFKKPEDTGVVTNDAKFAAPGGGGLQESKKGYVSEEGGEQYGYLMPAVPDFLDVTKITEPDNANGKFDHDKNNTTTQNERLFLRLRRAVAKGCLGIYKTIYMLFVLAASLMCTSNTTERPTRQISARSKYQDLIRESLLPTKNDS